VRGSRFWPGFQLFEGDAKGTEEQEHDMVSIGIGSFSNPSMASEGRRVCPKAETVTGPGSTTGGGRGVTHKE